jgi:uncharacterized protein (TIGR00369 family)
MSSDAVAGRAMTDAELLDLFRRIPQPGVLRVLNGVPSGIDQEAGTFRIAYDASAELCHSGGVIQGGFIAGMIDEAMAQAAVVRSNLALVPPTLELKISFYAPALPGRYEAEGRVAHMGRSVAFLEGDLRRADGTVIARATATARLVPADAARFTLDC